MSPWFTIDLCVCRPTGSTDCICFTTAGTSDAVTSALHIVVGEEEPVDSGVGRKLVSDTARNDREKGFRSQTAVGFIPPPPPPPPPPQGTRSQWTCLRSTTATTTPSPGTRRRCWDTVSTATCWRTARGTGVWARLGTTWQVRDLKQTGEETDPVGGRPPGSGTAI